MSERSPESGLPHVKLYCLTPVRLRDGSGHPTILSSASGSSKVRSYRGSILNVHHPSGRGFLAAPIFARRISHTASLSAGSSIRVMVTG